MPGERVWRNILKSDPSVDLVHFTILRPPEKQDGTPIRELSLIAFPIRELFDVKLDEFDLIIFDRYSQRGIIPQAYIENVVRYVRNGGALLEAAGPSIRHADEPLPHAARRDPADRADRQRARAGVPAAADRRSGAAIRSPPICPAPASRARRRAGDAGSARSRRGVTAAAR